MTCFQPMSLVVIRRLHMWLQRKKVNHRTCADLNHVFVNVNNSDRLNAANKVLGETTTTVLSIGKLSHVHMSIELELARR